MSTANKLKYSRFCFDNKYLKKKLKNYKTKLKIL